MNEDSAASRQAQDSSDHASRLTFKALMIEGRRRVRHGEAPRNAVASNEAALRSFARAHGLADEDAFTPLMGVSDGDFRPSLQSFRREDVLRRRDDRPL